MSNVIPAEDNRAYVFHTIPTLRQLLPQHAGLPGVEYAIVDSSNLRRAQDEGWNRMDGGQKIFTIHGPKGTSDCELYGRGVPIRGQDPSTGTRVLNVDKTVRKVTGLAVAEVEPEVKKTEK